MKTTTMLAALIILISSTSAFAYKLRERGDGKLEVFCAGNNGNTSSSYQAYGESGYFDNSAQAMRFVRGYCKEFPVAGPATGAGRLPRATSKKK
jgi:hypothetical protein